MKVKSVIAVKKSLNSKKQVVKGVASDLNVKQSTHSNEVGLSIGATINMGNYESMRIDTWGVEPLKKGETRLDASNRLKDELIQIVDGIRSEIEGED